eukprot:1194148-Prorocentrum_minimum.AAC.3
MLKIGFREELTRVPRVPGVFPRVPGASGKIQAGEYNLVCADRDPEQILEFWTPDTPQRTPKEAGYFSNDVSCLRHRTI